MSTQGHYPLHRDGDVDPSPRLPQIEESVLAHWRADGTFQASIDNREPGENGDNEFVFYDGPPFANGLPHYGHLLTSYVKDLVARFQTQRGKRVERRFGWDTHGLPAELEAERILGITDKSQIDEMGIEAFNKACHDSVLRYTGEWQDYVTRMARWVDFEHDYKTLDVTYMESVIWAFKQLYDKGLAYEGYRVLPYCWNDQTPLSNHELRMDDDVYQDRQDETATVGVRLETGELALIWTTTPWTLPSNLAIAVGPDIDYVVVRPADGPAAGERVILAEALLGAYAKELGEEPEIVERLTGRDLAGRSYAPIFDYFTGRDDDAAPGPHAWQIILGDFVTTEDGTGLVHLAPAFGEDDMTVCDAVGIRPVVPVDAAGRFTAEVSDYAGQQVFDANKSILTDLRDGSGPLARRPEAERALLVRRASYVHSYPHCWRCRTPLIYKAVTSWFVRVTQFRDRMVELNQDITWVPEHIKDGIFGNWLAGARDWSISRNRYWGTPIPVWVSDDPAFPRTDVYGSLAELEADFGRLPTDRDGNPDLHRPFIDELTRPNPDDPSGRATMRRIPDILDVWFDSGSMPFAQVHYPFENADWFEHHYPGDFIVEYIGQTRGWFYTLHVLATALFDRPSFRTSVSHGIVLGSDGRKMSKSLRNYPDVSEVLDRDGADAMRWFLMASPILRGGNLVVTEEGIREVVRQVHLPLWNAWYFYALYAGTLDGGAGYVSDGVDLTDAEAVEALDVMDRYLLARTGVLADEVGAALETYDVPRGTQLVREHLDLLTNWYVRTSRDRFWAEERGAFDTLRTALEVLTRVMAPLAPMVTEEVWRGLTGGRSVHLTDWPSLGESVVAPEIVAAMDQVREAVSAAHALRKAASLRVRQPLRTLTVAVDDPAALEPYASLIAREVNVRAVELVRPEDAALEVRTDLAVLPRELPKELRRLTSQLFAAAKAGEWQEIDDGGATFPGVVVPDGLPGAGASVTLGAEQVERTTTVNRAEGASEDVTAGVLPGGGFVALDTSIDDELEAEGYARDVVRAVQDERKNAGLHVSDRIALTLAVPAERVAVVEAHRELVMDETLSLELTVSAGAGEAIVPQVRKVG
ncbi:isoleucine--tRNA ligase [Georgenia sp. Z1344]|uniref:isoleucine--tRNA ligase n=1 Tax=Georgenia sp. Z1344 TaxID=3416706 RepID=UPI003CF52C33